MSQVFFSYAREDEAFVERLAAALEEEPYRLTVWRDTEDIHAAARWREQIGAAIASASTFALVLTRDYLRSEACAAELRIAIESGKVLAPLLCETDLELPAHIAEIQWIPFYDERRFGDSVGKLVEAVTTDPDARDAHARLLVRAAGWKTSGLADSLLRGQELARAEQWLTAWDANAAGTNVLRVAPEQRELVAASRKAARRRRRNTIVAASVVSALLVIASLIAWWQNVVATERRTQQHAAGLAEEAAKTDDVELGLLLAAESLLEWPTAQADAFLRTHLTLVPRRLAATQLAAAATSGAFAADDSRLYVVPAHQQQEGRAEMWTWRNGKRTALSQNVLDVVPAPRGSLVAVVRSDRRVDVIDGASGALVRALVHSRNVTRAAFSPDARYLATGSWDRRVRIWDVSSSGGPVAELACNGVVNNVAFMGRGHVAVLTAAPDFSIWSWETKEAPRPRPLPTTSVLLAGVATHDVAAVAAGAELFVFEHGSVARYATGIAAPTAIAMARSFDERQVAVGGEDGTVTIQHLHFGPTVLKHPAPVQSIDFSPDGRRVLVAAGDSAHVWDSFASHRLLKMAQPEIAFARFSHDGRHIVTAGANGAVTIWSDRARFTPRSIDVDGPIARLHFFPNGELAAVVKDPNVRFYADESVVIAGTEVMPAVKLPPHQALAFADSRMALANLREVTLLDERLRRTGTARLPFDVEELALSRDGRRVAAAGDSRNAALHDTATGRTVTFESLASSASSIAFAGSDAVAVSHREGVAIFAGNGRRRDGADDPFAAMKIASSHDGKIVAVAGADSVTRIRTNRLRLRAKLPHGALVHDLALNADGTRLVTAAGDGFVRIWDTAEARELARLESHRDVAAVAISSDERRLAFAKTPGRIEIWPWRPVDLRAEVCRSVSRRFTAEESRRYFGEPDRKTCP